MTVQTVPVAPLPLPGKPAAPASAGNDAEQTPFASVLQKKVDAGKAPEKTASASEKPTAREPAEDKQSPPSQAAGETGSKPQNSTDPTASKTPAAEAQTVAAAPAQDVLQTLFPWMQPLQQNAAALVQQAAHGGGAQATDAEMPASEGLHSDALILNGLPAFNPAVPNQVATPSNGNEHAAVATEQDLLASSGKNSGQAATELADVTAKLAASASQNSESGNTPLPTGADTSTQPASFEQALQVAAREQAGNNHAVHGSTNPAPVRMQATVGSPAWQNELGDQVRWMSNQSESRAELILTPPQLGRIEISLNISGDQANALFVSANPQVREALEGAMDRLREVLAQSGIALGQAQVGAESFQQNAQGDGNNGSNRGPNGLVRDDDTLAAPAWSRQSNNMLDVFA